MGGWPGGGRRECEVESKPVWPLLQDGDGSLSMAELANHFGMGHLVEQVCLSLPLGVNASDTTRLLAAQNRRKRTRIKKMTLMTTLRICSLWKASWI